MKKRSSKRSRLFALLLAVQIIQTSPGSSICGLAVKRSLKSSQKFGLAAAKRGELPQEDALTQLVESFYRQEVNQVQKLESVSKSEKRVRAAKIVLLAAKEPKNGPKKAKKSPKTKKKNSKNPKKIQKMRPRKAEKRKKKAEIKSKKRLKSKTKVPNHKSREKKKMEKMRQKIRDRSNECIKQYQIYCRLMKIKTQKKKISSFVNSCTKDQIRNFMIFNAAKRQDKCTNLLKEVFLLEKSNCEKNAKKQKKLIGRHSMRLRAICLDGLKKKYAFCPHLASSLSKKAKKRCTPKQRKKYQKMVALCYQQYFAANNASKGPAGGSRAARSINQAWKQKCLKKAKIKYIGCVRPLRAINAPKTTKGGPKTSQSRVVLEGLCPPLTRISYNKQRNKCLQESLKIKFERNRVKFRRKCLNRVNKIEKFRACRRGRRGPVARKSFKNDKKCLKEVRFEYQKRRRKCLEEAKKKSESYRVQRSYFVYCVEELNSAKKFEFCRKKVRMDRAKGCPVVVMKQFRRLLEGCGRARRWVSDENERKILFEDCKNKVLKMSRYRRCHDSGGDNLPSRPKKWTSLSLIAPGTPKIVVYEGCKNSKIRAKFLALLEQCDKQSRENEARGLKFGVLDRECIRMLLGRLKFKGCRKYLNQVQKRLIDGKGSEGEKGGYSHPKNRDSEPKNHDFWKNGEKNGKIKKVEEEDSKHIRGAQMASWGGSRQGKGNNGGLSDFVLEKALLARLEKFEECFKIQKQISKELPKNAIQLCLDESNNPKNPSKAQKPRFSRIVKISQKSKNQLKKNKERHESAPCNRRAYRRVIQRCIESIKRSHNIKNKTAKNLCKKVASRISGLRNCSKTYKLSSFSPKQQKEINREAKKPVWRLKRDLRHITQKLRHIRRSEHQGHPPEHDNSPIQRKISDSSVFGKVKKKLKKIDIEDYIKQHSAPKQSRTIQGPHRSYLSREFRRNGDIVYKTVRSKAAPLIELCSQKRQEEYNKAKDECRAEVFSIKRISKKIKKYKKCVKLLNSKKSFRHCKQVSGRGYVNKELRYRRMHTAVKGSCPDYLSKLYRSLREKCVFRANTISSLSKRSSERRRCLKRLSSERRFKHCLGEGKVISKIDKKAKNGDFQLFRGEERRDGDRGRICASWVRREYERLRRGCVEDARILYEGKRRLAHVFLCVSKLNRRRRYRDCIRNVRHPGEVKGVGEGKIGGESHSGRQKVLKKSKKVEKILGRKIEKKGCGDRSGVHKPLKRVHKGYETGGGDPGFDKDLKKVLQELGPKNRSKVKICKRGYKMGRTESRFWLTMQKMTNNPSRVKKGVQKMIEILQREKTLFYKCALKGMKNALKTHGIDLV